MLPNSLANSSISRIVAAYHEAMREIERDRRIDEGWDSMAPNNVWDESMAILGAAKRQLLGY